MKIRSLISLQFGFLAVFAAALFSCTVAARASVKVIADWRMGENDSGAGNGLPVVSSINSVGGYNLAFTTNSTYSTNVATRANSSLSISLTNQSHGFAAGVVTNATDHFGMEAWVNPVAVNGTGQVIAYNGNTGNSGWGIFINSDNTFSGLFGGNAIITGTPAQPGVWTDVALVRDSPNTVLYINGVPVATNSIAAPAAPAGIFGIGAPPQNPTGQFFTGLVDEVRVFTFTAGQFTTNDLLVNEGPPSAQVGPASGTSPTVRLLNGTVFPNGVDTTAWFEWSVTTNYGQLVGPIFVPGTNSSYSISNFVFGLSAGTIYHYALLASNAIGSSISQDSTFMTGGFVAVSNGLPGVANGSVAWGDYDGDGHLDVVITGATNPAPKFTGTTQVWRNNGDGTFSQNIASFPGLQNGSGVWGDYDNDGRLDILICGTATNNQPLTQVWHATAGGSFSTNTVAGITNVGNGSAVWGDYNNDGNLDALVVGQSGGPASREVWRNNGDGTFSEAAVHLGSAEIVLAWVDYNNDGRLDILDGSQLLRQNPNGTFTTVTNFPIVESIVWGDYDNDGWPDILIAGSTNGTVSGEITQTWHNNRDGTFTAIDAGLPGVNNNAVAWGDFDSDGWLDILITGTTNGAASGGTTQFWRNNGNGTFSYVAGTGLTGISRASIACGDYDNDGRLDILMSGVDTNGEPVTQLWRNGMLATNSPPQPPSGLVAYVSGTNVVFQWNAGSDLETPGAALTYNIRIGSASGGVNVLSPMSTASGFRRISLGGNAGTLTNKFLTVGSGTYYWSVQTIDNAFGASPFAPEQSFKLLPTMAPVSATNPVPGDVNGDGVVDGSEVITVLSHLATNGTIGPVSLNLALQNYLGAYPIAFSNVDGMGGSNVVFNVPGFPNANLSVQSSTDLVNWQTLGPVYYRFTDTNAASNVQRFYRMSYP